MSTVPFPISSPHCNKLSNQQRSARRNILLQEFAGFFGLPPDDRGDLADNVAGFFPQQFLALTKFLRADFLDNPLIIQRQRRLVVAQVTRIGYAEFGLEGRGCPSPESPVHIVSRISVVARR